MQKIDPLAAVAIRAPTNDRYRLGETHTIGLFETGTDGLLAVAATLVSVIATQNNTVKTATTKG